MRFGVRVTACALLIAQLSAISPIEAAPASAAYDCSGDTRVALDNARNALARDKSDDDRAALACLVEAVAALDAKIQGLSDGSTPFEGQIHIPKGWAMVKSPASEAD